MRCSAASVSRGRSWQQGKAPGVVYALFPAAAGNDPRSCRLETINAECAELQDRCLQLDNDLRRCSEELQQLRPRAEAQEVQLALLRGDTEALAACDFSALQELCRETEQAIPRIRQAMLQASAAISGQRPTDPTRLRSTCSGEGHRGARGPAMFCVPGTAP